MQLALLTLSLGALSPSADRFGGPESAPQPLPEAGAVQGWMATRTTRWFRLDTPECTRVRLTVTFADDKGHRLLLSSGDAQNVIEVQQLSSAKDGSRTLEVEPFGATLDVGIRIREHGDVRLAWSSGPCPARPDSTVELPAFLDVVRAWKHVPTAAAAARELKRRGYELSDESNDDMRPAFVGDVEVDGKVGQLLLPTDGAPVLEWSLWQPPRDGSLEKSLLGYLVRLGPTRLQLKDGDDETWVTRSRQVQVTLTFGSAGSAIELRVDAAPRARK